MFNNLFIFILLAYNILFEYKYSYKLTKHIKIPPFGRVGVGVRFLFVGVGAVAFGGYNLTLNFFSDTTSSTASMTSSGHTSGKM